MDQKPFVAQYKNINLGQEPFVILISEDVNLGKSLFNEHGCPAGLSYINLISECSRDEFIEHLESFLREPVVTKAPQRTDMEVELEPGQVKLVADLEELLAEAKAGEFGDFSNNRYAAPKMVLADKFQALSARAVNGFYDN